MERKGLIPNLPDWFTMPGVVDMLNEFMGAFGRIQTATDGQVLTYDSTVKEYLPETPATGLTAFSKKIGSFTIDTSTATGTQAVTGVGFQPQLLLLVACQSGSNEVSIGVSDGTSKWSMAYDVAGSSWVTSTSYSIQDLQGAPTHKYEGTVSALGADGFTVSWTKTGSPTGTLTVLYFALRIA